MRTAAAVAAGALALSALAACSRTGANGPESAWAEVTESFEGADFAYPDAPLGELIADSDLAVVAEFGDVTGERELAEDLAYVQIELIVREVIAGEVEVGDVLTFEGWTNEITEVPAGEMLMFLREKVSEVDPPGLWIWHTSRGIWAETERAQVDTPIAEDPPDQSDLYSEDISGAESLSDVVAIVEEVASR